MLYADVDVEVKSPVGMGDLEKLLDEAGKDGLTPAELRTKAAERCGVEEKDELFDAGFSWCFLTMSSEGKIRFLDTGRVTKMSYLLEGSAPD